MPLPRSSFALATARRIGSRSFSPVARTQLPRQLGRRAYSTAQGHATTKAGSDLTWALTSVAITAPTCYYLLQPKSHDEHHHEDHDHGDKHVEEAHEEEAPGEEEKPGTHEEHKDDDANEHQEDEQSSGEASDQNAHETTQSGKGGEGGEQISEVSKPEPSDVSESQDDGPLARFMGDGGEMDDEEKDDRAHVSDLPLGKGPRRDSPPADTRKHIPDAKGAAKKRIESEYGHRQGAEESDIPPATDFVQDKPATSKPAGGQHTMSGKQEGVSNTDTKFPVDLMRDHPTPHKGEGTPETAKSKGTIDPHRPQPEQRSGDETKKAD
ncbi:MAG: hypothetical protein M1816_000995 [Peltula sp. TS41687]|nr:MAG: hypothetical protein M1816_000995 [Peltula sp. TS41687]